MVFRLEINGLRALAVGLVILFHFRIPYFTGGFLGVDVFFVISGFLMTQIILGRLEKGEFSIFQFYLDRAKRIVPALVVMTGILLCVCWFFVEPGTFAETGRRAAATLLFVSNFLFTLEAGYFAEASESNLLLHTWSLSAEWQFYMLYPIFLALAFRRTRNGFVTGSVCVLAVLSFAISVYMISRGGRWPDGAYFLLPSRAWEMLLGAIVYIAGRRFGSLFTLMQRRALEFVGVGAIVGSALVFDSFTAWPSFPALIPTIGSALIILANCQKSSILRFSPLQTIGRCSYSVYLWHWPILGLLRYFDAPQSAGFVAMGVVASLVIGNLSYHLVERRVPKAHNWQVVSALFAAPAAMAFAGVLIAWNDGFISRSRGDLALVRDSLQATKDWTFPKSCAYLAIGRSGCSIGDTAGRPRIAVFGDSHAEMLYPRMQSHSAASPWIEFVTSAGCSPIPGLDHLSWGTRCSDYHANAVAYLKNTPFDRVIYASIWTTYFDPSTGTCVRTAQGCERITGDSDLSAIFQPFYDEIAELIKLGRKVYIVLPFPIPYTDLPKEIRKREFAPANFEPLKVEIHHSLEDKIRSYLEKAASLGATIVDPKMHVCSGNTCSFTDEAGRSLYMDGSHIRASVIATNRFNFLDALSDAGRMNHDKTTQQSVERK